MPTPLPPSLLPVRLRGRKLAWGVCAAIIATAISIVTVHLHPTGFGWLMRPGAPTRAGRGADAAHADPFVRRGRADTSLSAAPQHVPADFFSWHFPMPDGTEGALSAYRGKPLVLNFWASWCGPCIREMPALAALHDQFAATGVQFVGIGADNAENIKKFLQRVSVDYPIDYPVYIAGLKGMTLARALGNVQGGLPFTVVIDADGRIRWTHLGEVDKDALARAIRGLQG